MFKVRLNWEPAIVDRRYKYSQYDNNGREYVIRNVRYNVRDRSLSIPIEWPT